MRTSFSQKPWNLLAVVLMVGMLSISITAQGPPNPLSHFNISDLPNLNDVKGLISPWLNQNHTNASCLTFLIDLYNNPKNYIEPFMATGKGLNDYGDQFACRRLKGFTYLLFMIKETQGTNRALLGVCSPSQCKPQDYQAQEASVKSIIANYTGINLDNYRLVFQDPQVEEDNIDLDIYGWITYLIMGIIICLGLLGSYFDLAGGRRPSTRDPHSFKKAPAPTSVEFSEISAFSSRPNKISLDTSVDTEADEPTNNSTALDEKLPMGQVLINEPAVVHEKSRMNFVNFCKCFSFYTNGKKLFSTNKITDDIASTECLNGFRVLTMFWVILGHTFYYHLRAPVSNLKEWLVFLEEFWNQVFIACPLSVDSFLFLGGFLGAYLMLKEIRKRGGRINFLQVWIHRFYRIVPLYLLILAYGWKILPQSVIGVGGHNFKELIDEDCHDTWWTNIVFLNNYLPSGKSAACMGHSWYLAVDMQCFLPLPLLLVLYYKNRMAGWITALALFFGSSLLWFTSAMIHGWSTDLPWVMAHMTEYFDFYTKPYYRFGPYGLGIIVAFLISEYKDETLGNNILAKKLYRFWRKRIFRYFTYIAGITIIIWSIFIHYPVNNGEAAKNWSQFHKSLFLSTQRSIWVFGWSLIIMPAMMGWGSLFRGILGASFWSPLTRLTFGAYLIHPVLQLWYYWQLEQSWIIGTLNSIINAIGFATASYLMATCFSLMAESPAMNLEKFWMSSRKAKDHPKESMA